MTTTRREFLGLAASAAALPLLAPRVYARQAAPLPRPLRLLVLGGTGFIGPYVVRHARQRGHSISLFNRGRTNTDLFPDIEKLIGDRDSRVGEGLRALRGRTWDACIDNTGYVPRHVGDSVALLRDAVERYLFTSTRQVFADFLQPDKTEDAPRHTIDDPTSEDTNRFYGPLKVLCEDAVTEIFGPRSTIVRPTAVAGPGDRTDRFTYWPVRVHRGGEILAPGDATDPIQYIDVRDLAEFMVHLVETGAPGSFNVAGPHTDMGVASYLHGCRAITGSPVTFTWVPAEFLATHDIRDRREMPLWIAPRLKGETRSPINRDRAIAHGLAFRPLAVTAKDTLEWFLAKPEDQQILRRGVTPAQERLVLDAWGVRSRTE